MGAEVDVVEAYRTVKPRGGSKKLKKILAQGKVDVITFTSSSTVNHFVELLGKGDIEEKLKGVTIASIGPVTSRTAKEQGLESTSSRKPIRFRHSPRPSRGILPAPESRGRGRIKPFAERAYGSDSNRSRSSLISEMSSFLSTIIR